jgi:tetratricopeptide (TPR) repeat protein
LLVVALFFGDGSSDERLFWIGAFAILATLSVGVATFAGILARPSPTRSGALALGLLTLVVAWIGLTMAWSMAGDRSWAYLDRGLVYLAFAVLGLYAGALLPRPAETVASVVALLLGAVFFWALLGKVFPGLFPDGGRVARLRNPIGYWNALALLCAIALPLALWLASEVRHARLVRAGGVLLLYLGEVALVLTYSRAGILVAGLGVCLWIALARDRLEGLVMLAAGSVPAVAVCAWASTQDGLVEDLQSRASRDRAGAWFAVALILGAAAALGLSHLAAQRSGRLVGEERTLWARRLGIGIAAGVVVVAAVASFAVTSPGKWLDEFRGGSEVVQGSGRLGELNSNNRWTWWKEGWALFEDNAAGGTGAHTFEIARRPIRVGSIVTAEPHNIGVQFLSETGIVGLLLGLGAVGFALLACREALARLDGSERAAATALVVALPVYLLHALADIDWDFVAASAPVFFVTGVLLAAGRAPAPARTRLSLAVAASVVGLAALYSLTAPWLSARKVDDAYAALGRGDAAAAIDAARQARDLNPLSVEPVIAWALTDEASGRVADALRRYRDATALQPENSSTWYALGAYELSLRRYRAALHDLDRAWGLDPYGPAGLPGGLLDQARDKVNAGLP